MPFLTPQSIIRPGLSHRLPVRAAYRSSWRTMATAAQKKEWLAILPDRPNVLEIRKKVKGSVIVHASIHESNMVGLTLVVVTITRA